MNTNTFIRVPHKGDAAVRDIATREEKYINGESFSLADIDLTKYELLGGVAGMVGGKVLVTRGNIGSYPFCDRPWWYLSGFTLDGTERTGVLSIRTSADWATSVDKTITYNASDIETFITQLNDAFTEDTDFDAQDWYADEVAGDNTRVRVHCNGIDYRQYTNNTAKEGFTITICMPEITYTSNMRRRSGQTSGEGAIANLSRALAYFRSDLSSTTYNPSSDITSVKRNYPICLPGYLGTSQYQSDHCAFLRGVYGEGEEGWIKFMKSCLPVVPCMYGAMGVRNGKERTQLLASFTYTSRRQLTPKAMCPCADAILQVSTPNIAKGEFYQSVPEDLTIILDGVKYNITNNRDADALNKILNKMGFPAISNGSYLWSCLRFSASSGWCSNGSGGFFYGLRLYSSCEAVPVAHFSLKP